MTWLNLPNMPAPIKTLFAGYLLVVGVGLMMAGLQIMMTHGMADGKVGLSKNDIVYSYYGDRTHSLLENKLNGSEQISSNGSEKARQKRTGMLTLRQYLSNIALLVIAQSRIFLTSITLKRFKK